MPSGKNTDDVSTYVRDVGDAVVGDDEDDGVDDDDDAVGDDEDAAGRPFVESVFYINA